MSLFCGQQYASRVGRVWKAWTKAEVDAKAKSWAPTVDGQE